MRWAHKSYTCNFKTQMLHKGLKILVTKQQSMAVLNAECGYHAIQGFPDGNAFFS